MKLRLKFVPPTERKDGTSYLCLYASDKAGVMTAFTAELQVQRTEDEGMGHWERVELETIP